MRAPKIEILLEEECKEEKSFWKIETSFLVAISLGIPLFFIIGNLLLHFGLLDFLGKEFSFGLSLGNSIALLSAGGAITGTLYSNHRNEFRSEKQICEAGNRLSRQINNQNSNFKIQLDEQDIRLKKQLESQERNLDEQLTREKKEKAIFSFHEKIIENFNLNKMFNDSADYNIISYIQEDLIHGFIDDAKNRIIPYSMHQFHLYFEKIKDSPNIFNYLPPSIKTEVKNYTYTYGNWVFDIKNALNNDSISKYKKDEDYYILDSDDEILKDNYIFMITDVDIKDNSSPIDLNYKYNIYINKNIFENLENDMNKLKCTLFKILKLSKTENRKYGYIESNIKGNSE